MPRCNCSNESNGSLRLDASGPHPRHCSTRAPAVGPTSRRCKGGATIETYEVFAIRYASLANRKASENFIGGDPHESASDLDYFVWLARSEARAFVIDTGFDPEVGARRGRRMVHPPERGLELLGVDARKVKDVIITHLHYDHVGNFGLFTEASFHLQDEEMAYATGRHMAQGFFSYAYEADEVAAMVREVYKRRLRELADAPELVVPGHDPLVMRRYAAPGADLQGIAVRLDQRPQ